MLNEIKIMFLHTCKKFSWLIQSIRQIFLLIKKISIISKWSRRVRGLLVKPVDIDFLNPWGFFFIVSLLFIFYIVIVVYFSAMWWYFFRTLVITTKRGVYIKFLFLLCLAFFIRKIIYIFLTFLIFFSFLSRYHKEKNIKKKIYEYQWFIKFLLIEYFIIIFSITNLHFFIMFIVPPKWLF